MNISTIASHVTHAVRSTSERIIARIALWLVALIVLDRIVDFGLSPLWLLLGAIVGILLASSGPAQQLTSLGLWTLAGFTVACSWIGQRVITSLVLPDLLGIFSVFNFVSHINLIFICFMLAFLSTWYAHRSRHALSIEFLLFAFAILWLFAPHRDYRLDLVKFVTTIAWQFQVSPLVALIVLATLISGFLFWYLSLSPLMAPPFFRRWGFRSVSYHSKRSWLARLSAFLFITLLLVVIGLGSFKYHQQVLATRLQSGVGSEDEEGLSPLDFHSSLGSSQEPTALVRLEGDYIENPHTPMLYFRESAVSKLEGNELVNAGKKFDSDVSWSKPGEFYKQEGNPNHNFRTPLTQSIYSLVNMNLSFAIDYPLSLVPLKLSGENKKFKFAYRAYSMVPAYSPEQLESAVLGNPDWTPSMRAHYLESHPDPRYGNLAQKIVSGTTPGIGYAFAVVHFLNKNAIYTLTPNHAVDEGDDPVVPFLFGDLRGYCVHFAYATTYMLRSLGVPARVATGYLTDLSQAKDGHILLRMNDRHAWAEVYVRNVGWVPFDTQPEQVENHGEAPVDAQVLEELMGLLEPGEELLPSEEVENEPGMEPEGNVISLPEVWTLLYALGALLLLAIIAKAFLVFGWALPASPQKRIERALMGSAALLHDLGYSRMEGETLSEFRRRLSTMVGAFSLQTGQLLTQYKYHQHPQQTTEDIIATVRTERRALYNNTTLLQKARMFLSPASLLQTFGGKRW